MEFLSPKYLSEAYEILDRRGSEIKICAGLTHLLRFYSEFPTELSGRFQALLHVGNLEALSELREENGKMSLGSTATISSLVADPYLGRHAIAIIEAAAATSTPQIRNRRTLGGEIAWGSYHSPLITALLAFDAKLRVRTRGNKAEPGREETWDLKDLYKGQMLRESSKGRKLETRKAATAAQDLIVKVVLPMQPTGRFSFFRALQPKIQTENPGVVITVAGTSQGSTLVSARLEAAGLWMWPLSVELPLDGIRMSDTYIYERLYSFCERYNFEQVRRSGPPANQLSLIVFGLLKEGFSNLLGR